MDIACFTACRSEWTLIQPILRAAADERGLRTRLLIGGAHLSRRHGHTLDAIRGAGWSPDGCIPSLSPESGDEPIELARAAGRLTTGIADALERLRPRWLVVAGDRYEVLSAATAATLLNVPVAHVGGGETDVATNTDGNIRNAVSKLAHLHLVSHSLAAQRLRALGEEPWRIHTAGLPSLDSLRWAVRGMVALPSPCAEGRDFVLVSFLPVTLAADRAREHLLVLLNALARLADHHKLIVLSNADAGGDRLDADVRCWAETRRDATLVESLTPEQYALALRRARCYVGNSSSGIIETPVFGTPAVMVGERQLGRPRAANVVEMSAPTEEGLYSAIRVQVSHGPYRDLVSPYGDGRAAPRVLAALREAADKPELLQKRLVVSESTA